MTRKKLCEILRRATADLYDPVEAASVAGLVAEELYGVGRRELVLDPEAEVVPFDESRFEQVRTLLSEGWPAQYVIGHTEFCGLRFHVSPSVLIPRPETEELVMMMVAEYDGKHPRILDIGTGSGAIAVSLKRLLGSASVSAIDVSPEALSVAEANAASNGADVDFSLADIFTLLPEPDSFDVIVSNPPYVTESERQSMRRNVLDHEPWQALFVPDDDPLRFYRCIARFARIALLHEGELWFEINERFGDEMADMLLAEGFDSPTIINDMNSKQRIVRCIKR